MTNKDKIKVGQTVWVVKPQHRGSATIEEGVVYKCGTKYFFTGSERWGIKFDYKTLREVTEYSYAARVYLAKEEYDNEQEYLELYHKIRKEFDGYRTSRLTLQQLREINKIISNE
jgi:hypothetical protein